MHQTRKMSEDFGKEIAKEIAKEVYQDGGKAIAKSVGDLGSLLIRALKATLAPVEKWTLQREYNIAETRKLLEQKLERIGIDSISPPEPYIALPAMQYLTYCMDQEELRNMYANLLANSMIDAVKNGVHPGFVEIIKQLSPDEAKILKYMSTHDSVPTITLRFENENQEGNDIIRDFSDIGEQVGCEQKYEMEKHFDNLERLGLIAKSGMLFKLTEEEQYNQLKQHPYILKQKERREAKDQEFSKDVIREEFIRLTSFGKAFCDICVIAPDAGNV